jgi:hypothetical protein
MAKSSTQITKFNMFNQYRIIRTHLKNKDTSEGKAQGGEKTQHTRLNVRLLSRPATQKPGTRSAGVGTEQSEETGDPLRRSGV